MLTCQHLACVQLLDNLIAVCTLVMAGASRLEQRYLEASVPRPYMQARLGWPAVSYYCSIRSIPCLSVWGHLVCCGALVCTTQIHHEYIWLTWNVTPFTDRCTACCFTISYLRPRWSKDNDLRAKGGIGLICLISPPSAYGWSLGASLLPH